jgi:hypothetical protein
MGGCVEEASLLTNIFWRQILREQFSDSGEILAIARKGFTQSQLVSSINRLLGDYIPKFTKRMNFKDDKESRRYLKENVVDGLEDFVHKGVVFQQYLHRCNNCGNHNFLSLDTIKTLNECAVCKEVFYAPVDLEWRFTFSPYVLNTLVERNGMTVLWAIAKLYDETRGSGLSTYLPEVDLFKHYNEPQSNEEIDALAILDGDYYAIEVKRSAQQFVDKVEEREKFLNKIRSLEPDVACLAFEVYHNDPEQIEVYKSKLKSIIEDISSQLSGICRVQVINASDCDDFNSIPYTLGNHGERTWTFIEKREKSKEKKKAE